jgi:hypothetical protein
MLMDKKKRINAYGASRRVGVNLIRLLRLNLITS